MPSTDANAPSSSGAVEAPVHTPTLKCSPRALASVIRRAKAVGTAFGYPAPVNPLIPTLEPGSISAAASSADITLSTRPVYRMCERSVIVARPLRWIEHHDGRLSGQAPAVQACRYSLVRCQVRVGAWP